MKHFVQRNVPLRPPARWITSIYVLTEICHQWSRLLSPKFDLPMGSWSSGDMSTNSSTSGIYSSWGYWKLASSTWTYGTRAEILKNNHKSMFIDHNFLRRFLPLPFMPVVLICSSSGRNIFNMISSLFVLFCRLSFSSTMEFLILKKH